MNWKPSEWCQSDFLDRGLASDEQVYLDHNATTPPAPPVKSVLDQVLANWGNPSSIHWAGRGAKQILRESRRQVAELIGASPLEVIFTSGGSEANNLAIKGVWPALKRAGRTTIISSKVEHPSVRAVADRLREQDGAEIKFVKINRDGEVDWDHYLSLLDESVGLVSVMLANNETGSIFPIKKMAKEAHRVGALFHTDAVQMLGKLPLNVQHLGVDLASFSGHKFYSLKGVGVLFSRKGLNLQREIDGGGQERHRRGGTENLLAIASLAEMAKLRSSIPEMADYLQVLRDRLEERLLVRIEGVTVNGGTKRVPNTLNVSVAGVDGESLLMNLDIQGFAVSTGAACSSGNPEPSPALKAMGLTFSEAQSSLRISLGWSNTEEQVERFLEVLEKTVARLRSLAKEA